MLFAPDTEDSLTFTVALLNTVPGANATGGDELATPAELTELVDFHQYAGRFDRDDAELASVLEIRGRLRRIWTLSRDELVDEINAMLREAHASPQLMRHDALDWHLHAVPMDAPLAERIKVESAMALLDVARSNETWRMRACEAFDCEGLLLDLSKNGSKRFCSVRCGNRMNMVAWRARQVD
ncbi:MAG TPA: CGNR zinc finger domain-containing protein [Galbitalea sp.]|nr:CGNR zinc finger domain-containing protein [Galbitalea sp.]